MTDIVLPVPFHEAVCCRVTIVTQPYPTLPTEPSGFCSNLGGRVECTLPPLMPVRVVLVSLPDGKVTVRQGADDATTTASPTATGVVSNQLLRQLDSERLDVSKLGGAGVMLHQDVSICYSHI